MNPNQTGTSEVPSASQVRRDFLQGVTAAAGLAVTAAVATAQTGTPGQTPSPANDINLLNYALTLEYLEATFYTEGLSRFNSTDFVNAEFYQNLRQNSGLTSGAPPSGATGTGLVQDVFAYLSLIRNHEQQHVRTLRSTIQSLGGTPVNAPQFRFQYNTVDEFIALAATLENTGVAAYNGAIDMLSNPDLVTAAATIATVEGRHAAYLNRVRGMVPFPNAFDVGMSMAEILAVASQFIVV